MDKTFWILTRNAAAFAIHEYVWPLRVAFKAIVRQLRVAVIAIERAHQLFVTLPYEGQIASRVRTKAEVDRFEAEVVATLIKEIKSVPNIAFQVGATLFVRVTHKDGDSSVHFRTLTQRELVTLERHPDLLTSPQSILNRLSELSDESYSAEASIIEVEPNKAVNPSGGSGVS